MPIRMSRKKAIFIVVLALPVLIGGGYFSNMLTFTACEDELQAFSKEQWKGHGGGNGYVGELKQRMPFVVEIECGLPTEGMVFRRYLCLFGKPVVIGNSPKYK